MTDAELDLLMRDVLLDSLKLDDAAVLDSELTFTPSRRHQRRMRSMLNDPEKWLHGRTRPMWQKVMQRVAVFFLVCAIGFSSAMIASADVRKAVINWFIETFPQYSIFRMETEEPSETLNITSDDIEIGYIPEGYVPKSQNELRTRIFFSFSSNESEVTLIMSFSTGAPTNMDTEDAVITETTVKGNTAYWWEHNSITYLIWSQNNIMCSISGEISIDEAFKIAESIDFKPPAEQIITSDEIGIGYIPEGYVPMSQDETPTRAIFRFSSDSVAAPLVITLSNGSPSYLDTEDAEIIETTLKGNTAYWWEHNSQLLLVWSQNGLMCKISGEIPIEEAFKIAENIQIGKE